MLEKEIAKSLARKFSGLDFYPPEKEGVAELVTALQSFETNQQAERFVTDWMKYQSECPKPATIRKVAYDLQAATERTAGKACPLCGGLGFIHTERKGMDFSTPCKCHPVNNGEGPGFTKWEKPTDLCPDCVQWGAYGYIQRDGRWEQCPGSHDHDGERDVIQVLIDAMNRGKRTGLELTAR